MKVVNQLKRLPLVVKLLIVVVVLKVLMGTREGMTEPILECDDFTSKTRFKSKVDDLMETRNYSTEQLKKWDGDGDGRLCESKFNVKRGKAIVNATGAVGCPRGLL